MCTRGPNLTKSGQMSIPNRGAGRRRTDPPAARTCVHLCASVNVCTRVRPASFSPITRAHDLLQVASLFLPGLNRPAINFFVSASLLPFFLLFFYTSFRKRGYFWYPCNENKNTQIEDLCSYTTAELLTRRDSTSML